MAKILGLSFIESLLDQNYSVVLVMFETPTDSIQYNAEALLDLTLWVQEQAVGKDLVLVGPSMGGLVTRRALIQAAINGSDIHPRLFIAYDSPNWGATIPPLCSSCCPLLQRGLRFAEANLQESEKWCRKANVTLSIEFGSL